MSSEDNNNRVDSGKSFEGNSPSPSSLEDRQSPEISWTESSQHGSASEGRKVTEEGERGDKEASSLDHGQWSYVDLVFTLTFCDACTIASRYDMEVALPQERGRAHRPPTGHVTTSEVFLKFGVRYPLHLYFRSILNYYNLTMFQVTPNGWAHMIGFFILLVEWKIDIPPLAEFSWFYTLKSSKGDLGFYYFSKWASKEIQAITKIKESLGN